MKFKHPNNKFSESKFTLYSDEMHKQYSSEMLPNLKADVKRKQSSDEDNQATRVILSLYKTTKDTDGQTAIDKEEFLGKYELNLKDSECRKKYKFHDVGKEHLVTVKLSRNYQKPWAKRVDKWTK
jgi:hypothetical protein